jgi:ubiquinone/menaquinone biosynthesis C-methylase UbiE
MFDKKSYGLHSIFPSNSKRKNINEFLDLNNINNLRHKKIIGIIGLLVELFKDYKWLTIGDGFYGSDAILIKNLASELNIIPSDISHNLLEKAVELNFFEKFLTINAESIEIDDEEFEVVFCKEAFHHFPKAYVGLYEMIRISKEIIILMEPMDQFPKSIFQRIKDFFLFSENNYFEEVGNFVFSISPNEIFKIAAGLQLNSFYYKGYEDFYTKKFEFWNISKSINVYWIMVFIKKILSLIGYKKNGHIAIVIFKKEVSNSVRNKLKNDGFKEVLVPINPYAPSS